MANLIEELSSQARKLPAADRVRLAEELLASVHEPDNEVEAAMAELVLVLAIAPDDRKPGLMPNPSLKRTDAVTRFTSITASSGRGLAPP